jgi:hypothetical protein
VTLPIEIATIVEGDGELHSLPRLIHCVAIHLGLESPIVRRPLKSHRSDFDNEGRLSRFISLAATSVAPPPRILVVFDADDDCPKDYGPRLQAHALSVRPDATVGVVLAAREWEAWFLAGIESLCGYCGLADGLTSPSDCEAIRGAKEWLSKRMVGSRR